jgi:hypothetical protein
VQNLLGPATRTALAMLVAAWASSAGATGINFESDALGSQLNGFASVDSQDVHFYDSSGGGLSIEELDGNNALVVGGTPLSTLEMVFDVPVTTLTLVVAETPGDGYTMQLFKDGASAGVGFIGSDHDGRPDFVGGFGQPDGVDRIVFAYADYPPQPTAGNEVVYAISYYDVNVPEPHTLMLLFLAAGFAANRFQRG